MGVALALPMGRVTDWVSAMESPVQLVWGDRDPFDLESHSFEPA